MSTKFVCKKRPWFIDVIWKWDNNPYKWTIVPRVRHKVLKSKLFNYYKSDENLKDNYSWRKVIGKKSLASQLLSPPLIVGKIHSSRSQLSSLSSTALTPWLLIHKGGPPGTSTTNSPVGSWSKTQTKFVSFVSKIRELSPIGTPTLFNCCSGVLERSHL